MSEMDARMMEERSRMTCPLLAATILGGTTAVRPVVAQRLAAMIGKDAQRCLDWCILYPQHSASNGRAGK